MAGVNDLIEAYAAGTTNPAEAVARAVTNIEHNDPTVGSVVRLITSETTLPSTPDLAGPLWGVPFGVKDLIAVGGVPRGLGCPAITPTAPRSDAAVVRALRRAGAVPLATLRTYELGLGSDNPRLGVARNPYDLRRHPGGSSSGSAVAVASGQLPFALGTDTAGSVRLPAAWCNLTALKLARRSIALAGVQPLSPRFDSLGILARDARDLATVAGALLDPAGPVSAGPPTRLRVGARLRVGVGQAWFSRVDRVIRHAADAALSVLSTMVDLTVVDLPDDAEVSAAAWTLVLRDAAQTYGHLLGAGLDPDAGVGAQLRAGQDVSDESLREAVVACTAFRRTVRRRLHDLDLLVVPGPAGLPPLRDDNLLHIDGAAVPWYEVALHSMAFANIADLAVVTLPIGQHGSLPMGMQVVALPGREADLLRLATRFQEATDHHRFRPAHYYLW